MNPNHVGYWIVGAVVVLCLIGWGVVSIFRLIERLEDAPPDDDIEEIVAKLTFSIGADATKALAAIEEANLALAQFGQRVEARITGDGIVVASLMDADEDELIHGANEVGFPSLMRAAGFPEELLGQGERVTYTPTIELTVPAKGPPGYNATVFPQMPVMTPTCRPERHVGRPCDCSDIDVEMLNAEERANYFTHEARTGAEMDDGGYERCVVCGWMSEALYEGKCPGPNAAAKVEPTMDPRD